MRKATGVCTRRQRVAALWLFASWLAGTLSAQSFGRWWYDGSLGYRERSIENLSDGTRRSTLDQREFRASLGINGFLGHPAIGQFRLGLDLALTELETTRRLDTERTGLAADFLVLPQGSVPFRLYFHRQYYDYLQPDGESDDAPPGAVDLSDTWGGLLRIKKGPLRGTRLGFDRGSFHFVDDVHEETRAHEFVGWSRSGKKLRHRVKIEHDVRDQGRVAFRTEDLTLNLNQHGDLTEAWTWQMSAVGIQRQSQFEGLPASQSDAYRARTTLYRALRQRDQLDVSATLGTRRTRDGGGVDTTALSLFYRWRPQPRLEVAPFVRYGRQVGAASESSSQRVGMSVAWRSQVGRAVDWLVGARVSRGTREARGVAETRDESEHAYSVNASLRHGDLAGLRKELEVETGRNQLFSDRSEVLTELPGFGLPESIVDGQSFYRAKTTLGHSWDSRSLRGWAESSRSEATAAVGPGRFVNETLRATAQFAGRGLKINVSVGTARIERVARADEEIDSAGVRARWKRWRNLGLDGTYRVDRRRLVLAPDIDRERLELGLEYRVGRVQLRARFFQTEEVLELGAKRTNRGVQWSIGRSFSGWLPIVTGTQRRGVIR